jgi:DNA-binding protein HU-beta
MNNLGKKDIVEAVSEKTQQNKKNTTEILEALLEVITDKIKQGSKVNFTGFGSFFVKDRKARTGFNPKTGEKIQIPATKVPKFKAGATLKEAVK